eukprot:scaffold11294_cov117-Isochrysis_galbana.AAC.1
MRCTSRQASCACTPLALRVQLHDPVWPRRHIPPAVVGKGARAEGRCASRRLEWGKAVPGEPSLEKSCRLSPLTAGEMGQGSLRFSLESSGRRTC